MKYMKTFFIIICILLTVGCNKDIPEPEVNKNDNLEIDPVQMEYENIDPTVLRE